MSVFNPVTVPYGISVKYHSDKLTRLLKSDKGNWIDLRSSDVYSLSAGDHKIISLGVSMKLPDGYEAILAARSSLFLRHGLIITNGIGIIDNSYCGDNDIWGLSVYATYSTVIDFDERVAQFRIVPTMEQIAKEHQLSYYFQEVDTLNTEDRGGFGSTGTN